MDIIRVYSGFSNVTIENCRVEAIVAADGISGAVGAIGGSGSRNMTVRYTEVLGFSDGIKAETGSLYEYNYIHMFKPSGSAKHLDGIQGSGDSNWTARWNYVDMGHEVGANFAIFAQGFNGTVCTNITNITNIEFSNNFVNGGNSALVFAGGKDTKCANPESYITNARLLNNTFAVDSDSILGGSTKAVPSTSGYRYSYYQIGGTGDAVTLSGNILEDGRLLTSATTPHP